LDRYEFTGGDAMDEAWDGDAIDSVTAQHCDARRVFVRVRRRDPKLI